MKGQEDDPEGTRLQELWARFMGDGQLSRREEEELARAVTEDPQLRETLLQDQRIDGALAALGRQSQDAAAFNRQFVQRVAAEGDGASFVSSVERRMRTEAVAGALQRPRALRFLPLVLLPVGLAAAALLLLLGRPAPAPQPTAAQEAPRPDPLADHRSVRLQTAPLPAGPERVAQLAEVGGVAYVVTEAQRQPASRAATLEPGAGLVTVGAGSRAVVAFGDGTRLTVEGDTVLAQLAESASGVSVAKAAFLTRGRLSVDVPAEPAGRPLLVTTPHAEVSTLGGRFVVFVDGSSTRLDVDQGQAALARLGGGGPTVVSAAQYALVGERGDTQATPMSQGGAVLLVAGALTLSPADERVRSRLQSQGFEVHVQSSGAPRAEELRRARLIVISSTASARDMSAHYRDLGLPIIVWEPFSFDDLGMTGAEPKVDQGSDLSDGEMVIKDPSHPLAAGRAGTAAVVEPGEGARPRRVRMSYGMPGPQAQVVAVWPGAPSRAMVFAYERGAPMPGLPAAPGRRVGLFLHNATAVVMSETAWSMFDAAVAWCLRDSPGR
jgi:hypothetical protein